MIKNTTTLILIVGILTACSASTKDVKNNTNEAATTTKEAGTTVSEKEDVTTESISPIEVDANENIEETDKTISSVKDTKAEPTEEVKPKEEVKEEVKEKVPTTYGPSHTAFDALLKKYVTASGNVNYKGFKADRAKLDAYTAMLSKRIPASNWHKNEKLVYWINLYNASTIQLILDNYPVKSIMDINGGKAWDKKFIKSGTKVLSLNQVENDIIRPKFREPRIHFAVNCAAKSCPKLLNAAFMPNTINAQLDAATKAFINNKSKNTITPSAIKISKIFEWYGDDFGGKDNLIAYFNKYSTTKINSSCKISYMDYNWSLNQ